MAGPELSGISGGHCTSTERINSVVGQVILVFLAHWGVNFTWRMLLARPRFNYKKTLERSLISSELSLFTAQCQ